MKGMILAAGHGNRLRPLTDTTPKPLIKIAGKELILYSIELLSAHGIKDIIINTYHLAELVEEYLGDGSKLGVNVSFSREETLLGTGGGIKKCEWFLKDEAFVVVNCDIITDADVSALVKHHKNAGAHATMVVRDDPFVNVFGGVQVDEESGLVVDIAGQLLPRQLKYNSKPTRDMVFTGLQVMEPMIFEYLPDGASSSTTGAYPQMIKSGRKVAAFEHKGFWADIGSPERLAIFENP